MEAGFFLPGESVIKQLRLMIFWRGKPQVIRCDNGPKYISAAIQNWASKWERKLGYIRLIEFMTAGCVIVTSDKQPLCEAIVNN